MNAVTVLFEGSLSLFDSVLCVWFITKFNHKSFKIKDNPFWIPAIIIIFGYTIISDLFLSGFNVLSTLIFLALYITYALIIARKKWIRGLISACAFEAVFVLLSTLIFLALTAVIQDLESAMQGSGSNIRYIYALLHKILLFTICQILLKLFRADDIPDLKSGLLTYGFSLITVIGLAVLIYISALHNDEQTHISALIGAVAFSLANVILYVLIFQILKLQKERYEMKMTNEKLSYERAHYEEVSTMWADTRKARHDLKQHAAIVKEQLEEKDYAGCYDYVCHLTESLDKQRTIVRTENKILDYILNSKLGSLENTEIVVAGSVGDLSDIEASDLACLMGNILDNAVEALQKAKDRKLELHFLRQNKNRIIFCKNTVNESVFSANKELKTTKKDKDSHGFGVAIIRKIAKKYNGMVDFYEEDGMFCVTVVLPDYVIEHK